MSALFDLVTRRFEAGHDGAPPVIWRDPRVDLGVMRPDTFKPAAVLVAFTERERPGMLLIHRPSTMRAHPGQIALPGGRIDAGETPVQAALREANEELGIDPALVRVIGPSDRFRTGSGYDITPVVAVVPADLPIHPNPAEVAQWFEAPVDFLLDPTHHIARTFEREGRTIPYTEITWNDGLQDHRIWGVTAAILGKLAARLRWHD